MSTPGPVAASACGMRKGQNTGWTGIGSLSAACGAGIDRGAVCRPAEGRAFERASAPQFSGRRHRRFRRWPGRHRSLLRRPARGPGKRHGVCRRAASRPRPREHADRPGQAVHQDAGLQGGGWHGGAAQLRLRHPAEPGYGFSGRQAAAAGAAAHRAACACRSTSSSARWRKTRASGRSASCSPAPARTAPWASRRSRRRAAWRWPRRPSRPATTACHAAPSPPTWWTTSCPQTRCRSSCSPTCSTPLAAHRSPPQSAPSPDSDPAEGLRPAARTDRP